jgi:hypothetical protein
VKEIKALANVESASPAEIDAVWFEAAGRLNQIAGWIAGYRLQAEKEKRSEAERAYYNGLADSEKLKFAPEVAKLRAVVAPLDAEWAKRGGWSRYLICQSDGGHFHKNGCHSLGRGARPSSVAWVAELSGLDDNAVVEAVGFRACSQPECFPLAPISPAWARSEAEYKRKSQDERDAKYAKGLAMR